MRQGLASEDLLSATEFHEATADVLAGANWQQGIEGINRFLEEVQTTWHWRWVISPTALRYLEGLGAQGVNVATVQSLEARQPEVTSFCGQPGAVLAGENFPLWSIFTVDTGIK